jgi:glycosyltransferase involved in cell wall biosynthesis
VSGPLRVLVIGPGAAAASDALRFVAMIPALADHSVELVNWTPPVPAADRNAFEELEAVVGRADVVVLRRFYRTWHSCLACGLRTLDTAEAISHGTTPGHPVVLAPYFALRPLIGLLEAEPGALGHRAIVYDTDDDFSAADLPAGAEDVLERDLIEKILGLADLVTTATPVLAEALAGHTCAPIRVVRNALDPAWYADAGARAAGAQAAAPGELRVVYHGAQIRLRDYQIARGGVDAVARDHAGMRRVWIGGDASQLAGVVDEVRPWIRGLPEFCAALVAARPDIGLAPLEDTSYNRARSELHWLEYSLAGAPTIVTGLGGAGPYDVVRDGVDGLVARSPADWERHLRSLAASPSLRSELATRARERALAEYSVAVRAPEWADTYRWAAEHAGLGRARTGAAEA